MANKRNGPESSRRTEPESARRTEPESARRTEPEGDVEGHGRRLDTKATPTDEPGTQPESGRRTGTESESDVEGHNFGHNVMLSRQAAQSRESEIQRNLRQHEVKGEARRPFFKKKGG